MSDEPHPEIEQPASKSGRVSTFFGAALLTATSLVNPLFAASTTKPVQASPKATILSTRVNAKNALDFLPQKTGGANSLTHIVADHFFKAEQARSKRHQKGFESHFYRGMYELMAIIEKPVPTAYDDVNNVRTIGIGFNMSIPDGKSSDGTSRQKWTQAFPSNNPDFDACKRGEKALTSEQMMRLYETMLKDTETYLRKRFNQEAEKLRESHPKKKFRSYDELPANHRAALLSIHYQSPRIASRLYDELASGDLKQASKELLTRTLAGKYKNRRDVEHAILTASVEKTPLSHALAEVKERIDGLKWGKKAIIHAYNVTGVEKEDLKAGLKPNKRPYIVTAHNANDTKQETYSHVDRVKQERTAKKPTGRNVGGD